MSPHWSLLTLDLIKCDFDETRGELCYQAMRGQDSPNVLQAHSALATRCPLPRMCRGACKPGKNGQTLHEIEIMSEGVQNCYFIFSIIRHEAVWSLQNVTHLARTIEVMSSRDIIIFEFQITSQNWSTICILWRGE